MENCCKKNSGNDACKDKRQHLEKGIFMSPLRKPLILRTVSSSAFTLLEIRTYIEQNVNANSRIYGRVIRKSDKMKGVFGIGTFRSGLIYQIIISSTFQVE